MEQKREMENRMVKLTDEEAESLAEYLWLSFIPYIQDETNEVDNMVFIRNIANVWHKCDKQGKGRQDETRINNRYQSEHN